VGDGLARRVRWWFWPSAIASLSLAKFLSFFRVHTNLIYEKNSWHICRLPFSQRQNLLAHNLVNGKKENSKNNNHHYTAGFHGQNGGNSGRAGQTGFFGFGHGKSGIFSQIADPT